MNQESIEWLLEHAASAYEAEAKSTEKIRERINSILSLAITPCLGIAAYLVSSLRGALLSPENICYFWAPLFASIIASLIAIAWTAYTLLAKFEYLRVPSPSAIISYFDTHPNPDAALQDGQLGLIKEYSESVDHNFKQNAHRKQKLLLAQRFAFSSFCILLLCIPRWAYNFSHQEMRAQSVKIVSPVQISKEPNMSNSSDSQKPAQQPTNQQQTATPPQPIVPQAKPAFPKSTMAMDAVIRPYPTHPFPKSTLAMESFDPKAENNKKTGK